MLKRKKICASLIMLAVFACTTFFAAYLAPKQSITAMASHASYRQLSREEADKIERAATPAYGDAVQALPDEAKKQEYITLIASLDVPSIADALGESTVSESIGSAAYNDAAAKVRAAQNRLLRSLKKAGIAYTVENRYDTVLSGVAVRIKSSDFDRAAEKVTEAGGEAMISETYAVPKTIESSMGGYEANAAGGEGVTQNVVNVKNTGIFDSEGSGYDGTGTIVAVLDSGFDYTHTAYLTLLDDNKVAKKLSDIEGALSTTRAKETTPTLTAADVYISNKIPFAYDYADFDADVYPLESEHGTHVAAIIAGDDTQTTTIDGVEYRVRGVAPGAQLALMKVFSDVDQGAKQSNILAAVEDCVNLGVDAINMSLGMSAGFAREVDKVETNRIYDRVREAGISLICAASNDYNSTYGSEANGNLPLTSNPDSATVGSPSSYTAAVSVASISGVKTPYIEFEGTPIYYFEASNSASKPYNFMNMLLGSRTSGSFEYVKIPGVGAYGNYSGIDIAGKIALVRRGQNTFEEKVQAAGAAGAAGIIIYNNVSGDIRMNVGNYLYQLNNGKGVACISMSQDDGERLAAKGKGVIKLDKANLAGPFMSDFSSWGPLPDLSIKPEITAHGGDILSAIPGQKYDRLSGTSMASPNQCGVHTLVRQYVKEKFHLEGRALARRVNQLLMSTATIALNEAGNPYSVRKQGAGLANLTDALATRSFIGVKEYDESGAVKTEKSGEPLYKDTTKIELGDDPERTGKYELKFSVVNTSDSASSFDVGAIVYSEGVSKTLTDKDETTSDQRAYMLGDTAIEVKASSSAGATPVTGTSVTVDAGATLDVTVTLTLSQAAKEYLDKSFEHGMYVEGFVTLNATDGGVSLRAPFLAFYGDWTEAPIFDLTYFETNPDELNEAIDKEDKTMPDAYATRPIAGLDKDFIGYMGSYYFTQDPMDTPIPAQEEHIALSNGAGTNSLNYIYAIWAGLLRSCKSMDIVITEQSTGREIWRKTESNVRKSYSYGAGIIYGSVDVDFYPAEHNLKNNTKYLVTLTGHLDYKNDGTTEEHKNSKNTYSFVFTTDFSSPQVRNVRYYTEYEEETRSTRVYADIEVFDNHYVQCLRAGVWNGAALIEENYYTPVYGGENTTNTVTVELTDYLQYVSQSRNSVNFSNGNTLMLFAYDYAMNSSVYELRLPDNIQQIYFEKTEYTISENQTLRLTPELSPEESYAWGLQYEVASGEARDVARVVDDTLLGLKKGTTKIKVSSKRNTGVSQIITVNVLGPGDDGYRRYDKPTVKSFALTGYETVYAHFSRYTDDRDLGLTDNMTIFDRSASLKMYPGEKVRVLVDLKAYYPDATKIEYSINNERYVTISQAANADGVNEVTIFARAEGNVSVKATVLVDGKPTIYTASVDVEVKDPYVSNGPYLTEYKGVGGKVVIPEDKNFTQISQFAFSFAESVDKEPWEITEEDPYHTKSGPVGDQRKGKGEQGPITEIVIPEGVEVIDQYAFAKLASLTKVTLPKTLRQINAGAFEGCTSLEKVLGLENVQIISQNAFKGCKALKYTRNLITADTKFDLKEAIALGAGAFEGCTSLDKVVLGKVQSAAAGAFKGCTNLTTIELGDKIKIADSIFEGCEKLQTISVNAPVISDGAFGGCKRLTTLTLGADVKEVGSGAFANTQIAAFTVAAENPYLKASDDKKLLLNKDGNTIVAVAPTITGDYTVSQSGIMKIGNGAFSHAKGLTKITLNGSVEVGEYAFANLANLTEVSGAVSKVGAYAFYNCEKLTTFNLASATEIGAYAFRGAVELEGLAVANGATVGEGAFYGCTKLKNVTYGAAAVPAYAFKDCTSLGAADGSLLFTNVTTVGAYAFENCTSLTTFDLSEVTAIGKYAFAECKLTSIDLSALSQDENAELGEGAFYHNSALQTVTLAGNIGASAFYKCTALETVTYTGTRVGDSAFEKCTNLTTFKASDSNNGLAQVKTVGAYAFAGCGLTTADLSGVEAVGEGAFVACALESVTLPEQGVKIADGAFANTALTTVTNLNKVQVIGDEAFAGTLLTSADLSGATHIGRLAFADSALTSVTLGENLAVLGDNPFAATAIPMFTKQGESDKFGVTATLTTFDISASVKVIDGALYTVLPNGGYELVTLPVQGATEFTVAEGTKRIADYAAASNQTLVLVRLPYTLQNIGHGAFYKSNKLSIVEFGSVKAPVLEAEYDEVYAAMSEGEEPQTSHSASDFLNKNPAYIADYFPDQSMVWYNTNFKDYIGSDEAQGLTMTYPKNGVGYDSVLFDAYFTYKVEGAVIAEDATRAVIDQIAALPQSVTLEDEATVTSIRLAYNRLSAMQAALVTNYETLTRAEKRIEALKTQPPVDPPTEDPTTEPEKKDGAKTALTVVVVLLSVIAVALAAALMLLLLKKKAGVSGEEKAEPAQKEADAGEQPSEESAAHADDHEPVEHAEEEKAEKAADAVEEEKAADAGEQAESESNEPAEASGEANEKASEEPSAEKQEQKKPARKKKTTKATKTLEEEK